MKLQVLGADAGDLDGAGQQGNGLFDLRPGALVQDDLGLVGGALIKGGSLGDGAETAALPFDRNRAGHQLAISVDVDIGAARLVGRRLDGIVDLYVTQGIAVVIGGDLDLGLGIDGDAVNRFGQALFQGQVLFPDFTDTAGIVGIAAADRGGARDRYLIDTRLHGVLITEDPVTLGRAAAAAEGHTGTAEIGVRVKTAVPQKPVAGLGRTAADILRVGGLVFAQIMNPRFQFDILPRRLGIDDAARGVHQIDKTDKQSVGRGRFAVAVAPGRGRAHGR